MQGALSFKTHPSSFPKWGLRRLYLKENCEQGSKSFPSSKASLHRSEAGGTKAPPALPPGPGREGLQRASNFQGLIRNLTRR